MRGYVAERFGSELSNQPFAALVNLAMPSESRILKAALPEKAGGWGQISRGGFSSTRDSAYVELEQLVQACADQPEYHDVAGTCGRDGGCRCGCCFARLEQETRQRQFAKLAESAGK